MFRYNDTMRLACLSSLAFSLLAMAGCGNGVAASPSKEAARAALDSALKTWRDGGKPEDLSGSRPPVSVHDTAWSRGDRLESYEVLDEASDAGAGVEKQFQVRLTLTKPERTEEVTYHVLGVDSLMVFSDQDYLRDINMEGGPDTTKKGLSRRSRR
jgi:hypothetical protein